MASAYCFRISEAVAQQVVETDEQLIHIIGVACRNACQEESAYKINYQRKLDPRGKFPIGHYAAWADSSLDIFFSKVYLLVSNLRLVCNIPDSRQ